MDIYGNPIIAILEIVVKFVFFWIWVVVEIWMFTNKSQGWLSLGTTFELFCRLFSSMWTTLLCSKVGPGGTTPTPYSPPSVDRIWFWE